MTNWVSFVCIGIIAMCALALVFLGFYLMRNEFTYKAHKKIADAIYKYNIHMIDHCRFDERIDYDVMEEYEDTIKRFWDWKFEHVVSPEIFELIKPYLEEENKC